MSNEDNNEDRLTKNEFSELIQHLSIQEILSIEYFVSHNWAKLFCRKNMSFTCNICVVDASSFKNLLDHINGKRHKLEMERVKQLYHPDYTYPKSDGKEYIVTENSKNEYFTPTAAADCNNKKENTEKYIYNDKLLVENQEIQSNKSNIRTRNLIEIKPTIQKNQNIIDNSVKTSAIVNTEKEIIKEQHKRNEELFEEKETIKEQQKGNNSNVKEIINNELHKQNNVSTAENVSELGKDNKNSPENNANLIAKNISLGNDVAKVSINYKINSDKEIGAKTCIISEGYEKSQEITEENNLEVENQNNMGLDLKTTKIVINPAAALVSKKNSITIEKTNCEEEMPKYQTDKIIIPTANKNNIRDIKISSSCTFQSNLSDLPKFSVKSYSSKSDDIDVYGILGVEYVIKILRHKNDLSPRYECGLCELVLDGFAMQRHLEGYNHRLKFCEKHFPTAIRHYRQYMQNVPEHELFKIMTPVLEKLAKAIESHHGRNLPYECYERDFNLNRHEILAKAFSCRHASEQYGPTFTHVVGADEIDGYINGRRNYTPPTSARFAIFDIKPGESLVRSDFIRHQKVRNNDNDLLLKDRNRNRHAGRTANHYLTKDKDKSHKSYMSSGIFDDLCTQANIYDHQNRGGVQHVDDKTYNLMVDNFLKGTLKGISGSSRLRQYQKRSASPSSEVNSKKRKSLSPLRDNDIWQAYRHLVDQELNNLVEKFKQYRRDPESHPSYNEEWQKFWKRRKDELVSAGLDHRNYNYQPEWVKFIKVRIEELYNEEIENMKVKCRERLCLPMTNSHLLDIKYHIQAPTAFKGCLTSPQSVTSLKVDAPQVVSVLRLMTALEDSLGSLGPKIINLLSKALQAEKSNPAQVNAIILTDENCALIETAKEKFKGLVITGLFEGSKEKVIQQVIYDAEELLKYAYQNRQIASTQGSSEATCRTQNFTSLTDRPLIEGSLTSTENSLLSIDKKELASKLAASLVAQGKTDFDPQQLQQLLTVYTLIEKRKRGSGSFLTSNETTAVSKKKLSETLSDVLKSSSTSTKNFNFNISQQKNVPNCTAINTASITSFNSVLQNSGDKYLINSFPPQLSESAYGVNTIKGNQFEQHGNYRSNYTNSFIPHQQNSVMNNTYNNDLYQNNNRIAQNWMFTSNMEMNSSHDIGRPSSYHQPTNWRNF